MCLLGVTSSLAVNIFGHAMNFLNFCNHTRCVFQVTSSPHGKLIHPSIDMNWGVLVAPSLLLGIDPLLVIATTLEFISAQSPQSMKDLLVGVFLCHQTSFSIPRFHYHHFLVLEAAMVKWGKDRASSWSSD